MFPGVFIAWFIPDGSYFILIPFLMIAWGTIVCIFGAVQGILFLFGRLKMGCPKCKSNASVVFGNRTGVIINCSSCGHLRLSVGRIFGLKIEILNSSTEQTR